MNSLETYLRELRDIRSTGQAVKETSYYGPLANLLNETGKGLKPKVRCVVNLTDTGAGIPDGGLFTQDQLQKTKGAQPLTGIPPARGAIEMKGTRSDVIEIAAGEQVGRYCRKYGSVLVTNYRDFILMGMCAGRPQALERYTLAATEDEFWSAADHPRAMADAHTDRFTGYLMRVMLNNVPLATPKDLARFLASYARDALARVREANCPRLPACERPWRNRWA